MKYIVDTSIWIDHFHKPDPKLQKLLEEPDVIIHPVTLIELALGQMKNRKETLGFLQLLPISQEASHDEVLHMIESHKLHGVGLGAVDSHILASAKLFDSRIYTRDRAMLKAMKSLKVKGLD